MTPNLHQLEIHVTYRCNLRCKHCSNLITQAPSNEDMPLERIMQLLWQSVEAKHPWKWLVLHGGEPTLHPEFESICKLLVMYKQLFNPEVRLFLCTNGHGETVNSRVDYARTSGFEISCSLKDGNPIWAYHFPMSSSPIDTGEEHGLGCYQTERCGIAFNNLGFFECSPAAAMARLFGYQPMAQSVAELSAERLAKGFEMHCGHCGLSRTNLKMDPDAPMSPTWLEAIERYKQAHP